MIGGKTDSALNVMLVITIIIPTILFIIIFINHHI